MVVSHNHKTKHLMFKCLFQVLKTEQEIMELDHSGFTSQYPTVFAGNLGNGKYILQVVLVLRLFQILSINTVVYF